MTDLTLIDDLRMGVVNRDLCYRAADRLEELTRAPGPPLMYLRPQPGFVRVRVAVATNGRDTCAWTGPDEEAMEEAEAQVGTTVTHRCIAIIDVPPIQPVPEIPATVEEVKP